MYCPSLTFAKCEVLVGSMGFAVSNRSVVGFRSSAKTVNDMSDECEFRIFHMNITDAAYTFAFTE